MANRKFVPNKAVWQVKPKKWPPCVCFLEPTLEWDQEDEGKWQMSARSWILASVINNQVMDANMDDLGTNVEVLAALEQLLVSHPTIVLIMHGVENILWLLEASELFRGAGFTARAYFVGRERAYIELVRDGHKITITDIRNWLPGEPEEIGAWGGHVMERHPRWWPTEDQFGGYHVNVMFSMLEGWRRWIEFCEQYDLGGFSYSMSSLAYNYWTRTPGAVDCRHPRNKEVSDEEKKAFVGGFCYVHSGGWHQGDGYYLLDCNGLYGGIIRDRLLPYRHVTCRTVKKSTDLGNAMLRGGVIVHGTFSLRFGFLPVKHVRGVDWRHDHVDCWLPQPELTWVMEHGVIHEIDRIIVYDMKPLGREIGEFALSQRALASERGLKYEKKLWKLFITNFFGKLAQRFGSIMLVPAREDEPDGSETFISDTTGLIYTVTVFCGIKIISMDDGMASTFMPSVAAFITSYGRRRLWELCTLAGWDHVFYNDTDSLIVDRVGYRRLKHLIADNVPGMLRVDERGETLEIIGKKQYRIGSVNKDNTHPAVYESSGDGMISWIEKEYRRQLDKETMGSINVRRAHAKAWEARLAELREIHADVPF